MDQKTIMTMWQAAILGVVQGITEFLPISSSGHLILFPVIFGWEAQGIDFDVMMHLATLLAVLVVLREDIFRMARGLFKKNHAHGALGWKIALATVPVVIAGVALSGELLDDIRQIRLVAVNLILWGVILSCADFVMTKKKHLVKSAEMTPWKQAIFIGVAQAFALIPGTSRSGVTMSAGLFAGLDRKTAARFSFLLGIPAIAGAGVFTLTDVAGTGFTTPIGVMTIGFLSAFLSGMFAIRFLLRLLETAHFHWFSAYRIFLGIGLFFWLTFTN